MRKVDIRRFFRAAIALFLVLAAAFSFGAVAETAEDAVDEERGHYVFQPKVCSVYLEEVFGKTMCETWFNLVDAVMAGEDSFACPDKETYNWVMGQFRDKCFPPLVELIDYTYDRSKPVKNGVATFEYTLPREEVAQRIADFAAQIEDILNTALRDDYSDFEKALALYEYFAENYTYDHETAAYNLGYPNWICCYRVFETGTGICQEFSVAYAYLLMQVGIDATNMSGHRAWDHASHQWTYVRMNGHNYHIDPTYVIGDHTLSYFMMNDARREDADGYPREDYVITSNYAQDHPHLEYTAEDDSFSALWGGELILLDHEMQCLVYNTVDEDGTGVTRRFSYAEFD